MEDEFRPFRITSRFFFVGGVDGHFLIRKSVHGGVESPFTLTVFFHRKIFHLNVRMTSEGKWVLGKKKRNEIVNNLNFHLVKRVKIQRISFLEYF